MERRTGTVVFGVFDRGYWFILSQGTRYFCHTANWSEAEPPKIGDKVSFEIGPGKPGKPDQAIEVMPAVHPGVAALSATITSEKIEGVDVVRTEGV